MKPRSRKLAGAAKYGGRAKKPRRVAAAGGEDDFFEDDDPFFGEDEDEPSPAGKGGDEAEEEEEETADQKRVRIAKEYIGKVRRAKAEAAADEEVDDEVVGMELKKREMQESGRARIFLANRVLTPEAGDDFRLLVKHNSSVNAIALSKDDLRGFSASKDGSIMHWDVETGKCEKYCWPSEDVLKSHHMVTSQNHSRKRSKNVLTMAVSSDGRYLVSGGLDCHIHLWDVRTREHVQAFSGHKRAVSCLAFRENFPELYSGGYDNVVKMWNVEDRTFIQNFVGHVSDVLTMDCLRKERVLTVARDRTMRLWKIPESTHYRLVAPTTSSFESCCFINDNEFLSGFDDGSIGLWSITRKKPTHVVKNAHPCSSAKYDTNGICNSATDSEHGACIAKSASTKEWKSDSAPSVQSWVTSVAVCRGSDLAASGAANGTVHLWALESESRGIRPLFSYPLDGFVNSLAFAKSGRFLLAGVGKEPRLGRWGCLKTAQNGVAIHPLKLKEEQS